MKVKTAELSGVQLDVALALALGGKLERPHDAQVSLNGMHQLCGEVNKKWSRYVFSPSTDWSQCGPLIEKFKVCLDWNTCNIDSDYDSEPWMSEAIGSEETCYGATPQIAICRAVVSSKIGDEVDIPDELMEVGE